MKILIIVAFVVNIAFAKSIIYDLKLDGKQIGTLSVKTESLKNKQHTYKTHLKFSGTYMLIDYTYEYRENALFDKTGLLKFSVAENEDGERKKMSGKREGTELVFANAKRIKFSQLDVTPFDIDIPSKYDYSKIKRFTLRSFDGLTGKLVEERYKTTSSKKVAGKIQHILKKRNNLDDEVEMLTITNSGKLLKAEGEDFEMILRTKGK